MTDFLEECRKLGIKPGWNCPDLPKNPGSQPPPPPQSARTTSEADEKNGQAYFPLALTDPASVESDYPAKLGGLCSKKGGLVSETVKPWTVKGLPPEERNAAIAAAKREGVTMGEWLGRAIRHYVQHGNKPPAPTHEQVTPEQTRAEVRELVSLISELSQAGAAPPKSVAAQAYGLIRQRLKNVKEIQTKALPQASAEDDAL